MSRLWLFVGLDLGCYSHRCLRASGLVLCKFVAESLGACGLLGAMQVPGILALWGLGFTLGCQHFPSNVLHPGSI